MRIALIGYMGCGKSTAGKLLAERLNLPFIDLDKEIEHREGKSIPEIFAQQGEAGFRERESAALNHALAGTTDFILSVGGGTPCFFNNMETLNIRCLTVYLSCRASTLVKRIADTEDERPLLTSIESIETHLNQRAPYYEKAHHTISSELPIEDVVEQLERLATKHANE